MKLIKYATFFLLMVLNQLVFSQEKNGGWFSLGARSTISAFSHDGLGLGTGGQFRVQLNERVNTDWFADFISINDKDGIRSEYYHIGWSVLFYPIKDRNFPKVLQPYIVAGHCFDYNKKTVIYEPSITEDRWGSAVQAGLGTHLNITKRFDISITSQYMIHLTNELEVVKPISILDIHDHDHVTEIKNHNHKGLEGHLLTTLSLNYKIGKLW